MGISDPVKIDKSWKFVQGIGITSTGKEFYEEDALDGGFTLYGTDIYVDEIPSTPPGVSDAIVEVVQDFTLVSDQSVVGNKSWYASTDGSSVAQMRATRLRDWIPPRFGQGYTVVLKDNTGQQIFTTDPINWVFDYKTGILICENDPSGSYSLPLKISAYRYVGKKIINDSPDASWITIKDDGDYYPINNLEAALQQIGANFDGVYSDLQVHITDPVGAHAASAVSLEDTGGNYTSTDVEGALEEISSAIGAISTAAVDITITDAGGYYTGTEVETALQETGAQTAQNVTDISQNVSDIAQNTADLANHLSVGVDVHTAEAITLVDADQWYQGNEVEAGLTEIGQREFHHHGEFLAHLHTSDQAHHASVISLTPVGDVGSTELQSAIEELATEKASYAILAGIGGAAIIGIEDSAATITATEVEGALAELSQRTIDNASDISQNASDISQNATNHTNHLSDAVDAHDASAISVADAGGHFAGDEVETVLQYVGTTLETHTSDINSNANAHTDHLNDPIDAHDASAISIADSSGFYDGDNVEAALQSIAQGTLNSTWQIDIDNATAHPTIKNDSGSLVVRNKDDSADGRVVTGDLAVTGVVDSNLIMQADILPEMTGALGNVSVRNIGSATQRFSQLYVESLFLGSSTLYLNGKPIIQEGSGGEAEYSNQLNEDVILRSTGTGVTTVDSETQVNIEAPDIIATGAMNVVGSLAVNGLDVGTAIAESTGTTSQTWLLDSDSGAPVMFKNDAGVFAVRDGGDTADADITVADLTASGDVDITGTITNGGLTLTQHIHQATGTIQNSWDLDSDSASPVKLKQVGGELSVRNSADSADAGIVASDATLSGTLTVSGSTLYEHIHNSEGTTQEVWRLDSDAASFPILRNEAGALRIRNQLDNADADITLNELLLTDTSDVRLKSSAGTLAVRNSADNADAPLTAGTTDLSGVLTVQGKTLYNHIHDAVGTTSNIWSLDSDAGTFPRLKNDGGALRIRNAGDSADANLICNDLTVNGTATIIHSEEMTVADNIITLNSNVTGTPSENGGIYIERGTSTNASMLWDEGSDLWKAGLAGAEIQLLRLGDESIINHDTLNNVHQDVNTTASPQFAGATITNLTVSTTLKHNGLTGNRALIIDGSNNLWSSVVTDTELGYVSGVTSSIQTQINNLSSGAGSHASTVADTGVLGHIKEDAADDITISATGVVTVDNDSHNHSNSTIDNVDWSKLLNVPDPTITLSGDVSGAGTMTNLGSTTITCTVANDSHSHTDGTISNVDWSKLLNVPDPVITISGDASGSGTMTNLGSTTISIAVANDSHNHSNATITSVDWSKLSSIPDPVITINGDASGSGTMTNLGSTTITLAVANDSHDHSNSTITSVDWSKLSSVPDPTITLNGDVSGAGTMTNLGSTTITCTVANDSHSHSNYSLTSHNHSGVYAPASHTHSQYSLTTHNHDTSYSAISHNHSGVYAPASHTHSQYASTSHNHDSSYAAISHSHSGYAPVSHTQAWSTITSTPAYTTRWPSWGEVTGKPSSFTPSAHSHDQGDLNCTTLEYYYSGWGSYQNVLQATNNGEVTLRAIHWSGTTGYNDTFIKFRGSNNNGNKDWYIGLPSATSANRHFGIYEDGTGGTPHLRIRTDTNRVEIPTGDLYVSGTIIPNASDTSHLGTTTDRFNNLYMNGNILPNASDTSDLGSTSERFANLYMASTINAAGALTVQTGASNDVDIQSGLKLSTFKGTPSGGEIQVDGTTLQIHNGSGWEDVGTGSGGSGFQPLISDVRYITSWDQSYGSVTVPESLSGTCYYLSSGSMSYVINEPLEPNTEYEVHVQSYGRIATASYTAYLTVHQETSLGNNVWSYVLTPSSYSFANNQSEGLVRHSLGNFTTHASSTGRIRFMSSAEDWRYSPALDYIFVAKKGYWPVELYINDSSLLGGQPVADPAASDGSARQVDNSPTTSTPYYTFGSSGELVFGAYYRIYANIMNIGSEYAKWEISVEDSPGVSSVKENGFVSVPSDGEYHLLTIHTVHFTDVNGYDENKAVKLTFAGSGYNDEIRIDYIEMQPFTPFGVPPVNERLSGYSSGGSSSSSSSEGIDASGGLLVTPDKNSDWVYKYTDVRDETGDFNSGGSHFVLEDDYNQQYDAGLIINLKTPDKMLSYAGSNYSGSGKYDVYIKGRSGDTSQNSRVYVRTVRWNESSGSYDAGSNHSAIENLGSVELLRQNDGDYSEIYAGSFDLSYSKYNSGLESGSFQYSIALQIQNYNGNYDADIDYIRIVPKSPLAEVDSSGGIIVSPTKNSEIAHLDSGSYVLTEDFAIDKKSFHIDSGTSYDDGLVVFLKTKDFMLPYSNDNKTQGYQTSSRFNVYVKARSATSSQASIAGRVLSWDQNDDYASATKNFAYQIGDPGNNGWVGLPGNNNNIYSEHFIGTVDLNSRVVYSQIDSGSSSYNIGLQLYSSGNVTIDYVRVVACNSDKSTENYATSQANGGNHYIDFAQNGQTFYHYGIGGNHYLPALQKGMKFSFMTGDQTNVTIYPNTGYGNYIYDAGTQKNSLTNTTQGAYLELTAFQDDNGNVNWWMITGKTGSWV